MATDITGCEKSGFLSAAATRLFGAISRQEWDIADQLQAQHPGAYTELVDWELIATDHGGRPIACDPKKAVQRRMELELEEARTRVARMSRMPGLAGELDRDFQAAQLRAPGGSTYLADAAVVNARLQDIVSGARREILAAQPGGPRSRDLLEIAVSRDVAALDRGVSMRTIYRDTVRDHAVTGEYARTMSTRTVGPAGKYATLVGDFERMIIVDREAAFVSDHIVEGSPAHSAWLITDPAAVAVLAKVFDAAWRRAQPWTGELRASRGQQAAMAADHNGVRTSCRQRGIMRLLCAGVSQSSTAQKIGISRRKLEQEIAALKTLWGVRTLNELIYQYALSPDRLVDDSIPATEPRPAYGSAA